MMPFRNIAVRKRARALAGFTLIELLVVISIIALLSSIVLAALNSARARARDAQRVEEMRTIQDALELYFNKYGGYPDSSNCVTPFDGFETECYAASASSLSAHGGHWILDSRGAARGSPGDLSEFLPSGDPLDPSGHYGISAPFPYPFAYWSQDINSPTAPDWVPPYPPPNNGSYMLYYDLEVPGDRGPGNCSVYSGQVYCSIYVK